MNQNHFAFGVGLILLASSAFASHADPYVVQNLRRETAELNRQVQNSYLHYSVKQAVATFGNEVEGLAWCNGAHIPEPFTDVTLDRRDPRGNCQYQIDRVRQSFGPVQHYLRDSYRQFPYIHQQYVRVEREVYQLGNPAYPPAPPQPPHAEKDWYADGALDGRRFSVQARNQNRIYNKCLNFASRQGIRHVRRVDVNGRSTTYWNAVSVEQACAFVSQSARYRP